MSGVDKFERLSQSELFQRVGDICAAVNAVSNVRELLEVSLRQTMDLFGALRGSIFILGEDRKELVLEIGVGMAAGEQEAMVKGLGQGVIGRVAESKKPIFVEDIEKDARFLNFKARGSYQTPSFLCAPLLVKDKLLGVISIADKDSGNRFCQDELQFLDFLSSQIALNYSRMQLYHKFERVLKESDSLKDELGRSSLEADYLKRQIVLQEKLATIGKLVGGIAHEFNNPLDGVMRYTNLCLDHVKEDEVVRGYLLEIKHGLKRMANIVKSLLACSRNTTFKQQRVNPHAVLEQVVEAISDDIVHKNIVVEKKFCEGCVDLVDAGLERIFANLMRNAIDSIEGNGRIILETSCADGEFVMVIKDSGCGIPSDNVQEIFEPFHTTKDIDKGCGLGLTIVSEIVKSYGGRINVASEVGAGTTFTVGIPISDNILAAESSYFI